MAKRIFLLSFLFLFFITVKVFAAGTVKTLNYRPDKIYTVNCKPGFATDFKFKSKILAFALGDQVRWIAQPVLNNLFVKPIEKHLETSLSVITQKRSYQFIVSSQNPDAFEQLVTFRRAGKLATVLANKIELKLKKKHQVFNTGIKKLTPTEISKIKFGYIVSGSRSIRPLQVFSFNGFVYIYMPKKLQSMPAFFIMSNGHLDLINYVVRGRYMIVERLFKKGALKLGKKESFIYKKTKNSGFNW
jgi:type IV secretory pathway VirB9-like protein